MADTPEPQLPAWNWSKLTEDDRRVEFRDLADWVADLQVTFGRWVRLPPCWPSHRALRDELAAYWYWRQRLDRTPGVGAEENVRWYQHLRSAAHVWAEAFGGCRHETMGEIDEQRIDVEEIRAAARVHVEREIMLASEGGMPSERGRAS